MLRDQNDGEIATTAVDECRQHLGLSEEGAIQHICECGDTLAKVIDEYNWATCVGGIPTEGAEDTPGGRVDWQHDSLPELARA